MRIIIAIVLVLAVCGCKTSYLEKIVLHPGWEQTTIVKACLEGHLYYIGYYSGGIAPVLTDDGKPVKCEE